jgi:hypothetical protein
MPDVQGGPGHTADGRRGRRLLWFVGLWCAGVLGTGLVSAVIRAALQG